MSSHFNPSVPDILEFLFRRYEQAHDGRRPSLRRISLAVADNPSYVRKLYDKTITNPGREAILDLATYFQISPLIFFPEVWELYAPELRREYNEIMAE